MPLGVEVVSPEAALLGGEAAELICRTSEGNLTVMAGHADMVGDVVSGEVRVVLADGTTERIAVHGGFLQVLTGPAAAEGLVEAEGSSTRATVLAGVAERASEIDLARAQVAREAAEAKLSELRNARGDEDRALELAAAEASLARAELRIAVASSSS